MEYLKLAGSKRVPLPVPVLLTGILALFYLGLIGFIVWVGIYSKSKILMAVSAVVVIGSARFWSGVLSDAESSGNKGKKITAI